jgi:nucleotide-binding universal stress UspA family protein
MAPAVRRVLAATDFSPAGDAAIAWAAALVPPGGRLLVVHGIDVELFPSPLYSHYSPGVNPTPAQRAAQVAELEDRLRERLPPGAAAGGREVRVEVLKGNAVAKAIRAAADRFGADVLVLGSHRKGVIREALLGSVAHDVVVKAKRPVLLVPPPPKRARS